MSTTPTNAPEVSEGLRFLLQQTHGDLFALIDEITADGGKERLGVKEIVEQVRHERNLGGFRYIADGWIQGHLLLGFLPESGFVVHTAIAENGLVSEKSDFYNEAGVHTHTQAGPAPYLLILDALEMDLSCPLRDQLYNFLAVEYNRTKTGGLRTAQIYRVERYFRTQAGITALGASLRRRRDPLIRAAFDKILEIEADPVLNWEERQVVYGHKLEKLTRVLKVKQRARGIGAMTQSLILLRFRWASFWKRLQMRPANNIAGIAYALTIQKMIWFFHTVRSNLGLSIAMAVYGPFTYFFITMPMNPHAMNAVNKIQSMYLDTKRAITAPQQAGHPEEKTTDEVSTKAAAPITAPADAIVTPPTNPDVMLNSATTSVPKTYPLVIDGRPSTGVPSYLNFLLTTDVAAINSVNWSERMGYFKNMQAAFEASVEASSRIGRLEQLETQYNFPMVVESAWEEMERYNAAIFRLRQRHANFSPKLKQYLTNEVNRTQQLELYLWDRLARFILDQPYVMLDQDKEQERSDYYVGRAFVFMEQMTQTLSWRYPEFKRPQGYDKIAAMAKQYRDRRQETGSIMNNLRANSVLFKQKDATSTKEFRSYMLRQWEILYLQNLKVEEAANNGLNMYIWSVRNTVWCLQSIYSAKRLELDLLIQKELDGKLDDLAQIEIAKVDGLYETLFHNLTMEWVSIKDELGSKLAKDIETTQRALVIENLKEFISDRAKLFTQTATTAVVSDKLAQ